MLQELQPLEARYRNLMIMGGGHIGSGLARQLENTHNIKLIELSHARAEQLSAELSNKTLVLQGDATDQEMLNEERIEDVDLFVAVTNDDEANIMAALLAKRMGAKKNHGADSAQCLCGFGSRWRNRYCHFTANKRPSLRC